jgi:hypothetical protein
MSEPLDVADAVVESGTDRSGLVCEEKRENNSGDGELHGIELKLELLALKKRLDELRKSGQCTPCFYTRLAVSSTSDSNSGYSVLIAHTHAHN